MLGTAEEFGLSLVILALVFACAALVRRWSRPLRAQPSTAKRIFMISSTFYALPQRITYPTPRA
jgi:hypothetical protein